MSEMMRAKAKAKRWGALPLLALLGGCARDAAPPAPQPVLSSSDDARAFTERFFTAYVKGDAKAAVDMLCAGRPASLERARHFIERSQRPESPYRVETFTIRSIGTHWMQREPYFRVEVSFPTAARDGEVLHAYTLRAKEGCMEGFLDGERATRAPTSPSDLDVPGGVRELPSSPAPSIDRDGAASSIGDAGTVIEL